MKKFTEIRNKKELLERVEEKEVGGKLVNYLSCGNQYWRIQDMLTKERFEENQLEVYVNYTNHGKHTVVRYL